MPHIRIDLSREPEFAPDRVTGSSDQNLDGKASELRLVLHYLLFKAGLVTEDKEDDEGRVGVLIAKSLAHLRSIKQQSLEDWKAMPFMSEGL